MTKECFKFGGIGKIFKGGSKIAIKKTRAGVTALERSSSMVKKSIAAAKKSTVLAKTGDNLKSIGSAVMRNKKTAMAALTTAGLTYAVADRMIDKFNKTDGTKCYIRSITNDSGEIYILFTPVDSSTDVSEYCSGSNITIESDNGTPTLAGSTSYIIDSIISTEDPQLSINSIATENPLLNATSSITSITFTTEATSGLFTYHADIASLAVCASLELGGSILDEMTGALCDIAGAATGLDCSTIGYIAMAIAVVILLLMLVMIFK
jgi:hypothetical protein